MKKLFSTFLALLIIADTLFASTSSGSCGDNLTWKLSEDFVLTISGTGAMNDYVFSSNKAPWHDFTRPIKQIIIENGITRIGNCAFQGCGSLTSTTLDIPNSVISIGEQAFYGCNLTAITLPNSVTHIEAKAFYGCSSLKKINIPGNTINIGEQAFYLCSNMEEIKVELENMNYKDLDGVLYSKDGSTLLQFPLAKSTSYDIVNGTTRINDYAFDGCKNIVSVNIPNTITTIGNYAFSSCSNLTSIIIPNSVTYIGEYVFDNCQKLTTIDIPYSVQSIGTRAFFNCTGLNSIKIGSGVVTIGNQAFIWCSAITTIICTAVEPPALGEKAFNNVDNTVCKLYVPASSIDAYRTADRWSAFTRIYSLEDIPSDQQYIAYGTCGAEGNESNVTWKLTFDSVLTISGSGAMKNYSFSNPWYLYRNSIKSVIVENNITNIGDYAFHNCSNIISVTMPNSVTRIGQNASYYCYNLQTIDIPTSVTNIGMAAFEECNSLTTIEIPNGVTMLDYCVFEKCQNLKSVYLPASLTEIKSAVFRNCPSLLDFIVDVNNPNYSSIDGVLYSKDGSTLIQYTAGRSGNFKIPQQVTTIGSEAFRNCEKLVSITIPESVAYIGYQSFSECLGLKTIICKSSIPPTLEIMEMSDEMFYGVNSSIPLYVPKGCVDVYRTTTGWSYFTNIVEDVNEGQSFSITYLDKHTATISSEDVVLNLPEPPVLVGFTFQKWVVVAGDLEDGITIQAVYQADVPSAAPAVYTNPANPAQKLIKNGNVYILSDDKTYTITGQNVK